MSRTALISFVLLMVGSTAFAQDRPTLPTSPYDYVGYAVTNLPEHYLPSAPFGDAGASDNTPVDNPITNDGATLGRVLFYDKRLSFNRTISCASCHTQETGFSDSRRLSVGATGLQTFRNSMGLTNAKFFSPGTFRWDLSAPTLEAQCLIPIEAPDEMGLSLTELRKRLRTTRFYGPLFQKAFGSTEITDDRIAKAMAQFIRSMVSYNSKFDSAFAAGTNGIPDYEAVFTPSELMGVRLFDRLSEDSVRCDQCHESPAQIADRGRNIGLDRRTIGDPGMSDGKFKVPSLRNVEVSGPFMHDGRFRTLEEVIDFYDSGVKFHPQLDDFLRRDDLPGARPARLNLSQEQKDALVAFLKTMTDQQFLSDPKFSDPFIAGRSSDLLQATRLSIDSFGKQDRDDNSGD